MGATGKGINASRRISASGRAGVQDEVHDLRTTQPASTFLRAVVTRVLNDPTQLDDDIKIELKNTVSNPSFISRAPRNSVIVRIISNGADKKGGTPVLCYPFLPPHICMPVKAGEQVWILFENSQAPGALPHWMWRAPEPSHVDDVNYTHADRKFDRTVTLSTSEKASASEENTLPSFPNGGGTSGTTSLIGINDYEEIVSSDPSYENFTPEPVPRFSKRPGDLALQGSNNTLIVMGEDRKGPAQKEDDEKKSSAGAIDIVVGRGRFLPDPNAEPSETAPRVIENTRGNTEVEKNPEVNGLKDNPTEGDPDYVRDSSRIYLSMNSDGDEQFNLSGNVPSPFDESADDVTESPFAVMKSDEVRIIARKDDNENINGSIRIIKEGDVGGDQVALLMLPNGTAQLDADVIYLGRPGGSGPGSSGSEPYIKFSKYKSQLEELIGIIDGLLDSYTQAFGIPVAAPGTPHPGLTANAIPANVTAKAELDALKIKIDEAKSSRIFGE
jgi:hypothetical protein